MKIVLCGCLCRNHEEEKQIVDGFNEEFKSKNFKVLGSYATLPGHGGEGGRSDVVVEMPDDVVSRAATHPWHLSGLFRWYDDYLASSRSIVPPSALRDIYGEQEVPTLFQKPKCKLVGENGNIYNLIGVAKRALKDAGMRDKADELSNRIVTKHEAHSYDEALRIIMEYVEVE